VCHGRAASKIPEQTQRCDALRTFANNTVGKYPGKDVMRIFIPRYSSEEESCRRFPLCNFVETYPSRAFLNFDLVVSSIGNGAAFVQQHSERDQMQKNFDIIEKRHLAKSPARICFNKTT